MIVDDFGRWGELVRGRRQCCYSIGSFVAVWLQPTTTVSVLCHDPTGTMSVRIKVKIKPQKGRPKQPTLALLCSHSPNPHQRAAAKKFIDLAIG